LRTGFSGKSEKRHKNSHRNRLWGSKFGDNNNNNPMVLVREQTIPTEQPPLFGEVGANVFRTEGVAWSAGGREFLYFTASRQAGSRVLPTSYPMGTSKVKLSQ
jgi:hypothetical protein